MEKLSSEQNAEIKDIKIQKLEASVSKLRRDTQELEKAKEKLRDEIKVWKKKYEYEKSEHEFYQNSAMDSKRKNKLLKVVVGRLQFEYDKLQEKYKMTGEELQFIKQLNRQIDRVQKSVNLDEDDADSNTFLTRISEDGNRSQKGETAGPGSPTDNAPVRLPDLQIKTPMGEKGALATDESFMSAGVGSVASSRNSNKNRFFTTKH